MVMIMMIIIIMMGVMKVVVMILEVVSGTHPVMSPRPRPCPARAHEFE